MLVQHRACMKKAARECKGHDFKHWLVFASGAVQAQLAKPVPTAALFYS
jgi:hypothetical protein